MLVATAAIQSGQELVQEPILATSQIIIQESDWDRPQVLVTDISVVTSPPIKEQEQRPTQHVESNYASQSVVPVDTHTVRQYVASYFPDAPVMMDVAYCESTFRHFKPNGEVLRGHENGADVGVMQINEKYHLDTANRLGINIYSLEGNLEYARYLYDTQGTQPWFHSEKCWGPKQIALR